MKSNIFVLRAGEQNRIWFVSPELFPMFLWVVLNIMHSDEKSSKPFLQANANTIRFPLASILKIKEFALQIFVKKY